MKASFHDAGDEALLDPMNAAWRTAGAETLAMIPAPVGLAAGLSPLMALSKDHGKIRSVDLRVLHNGRTLNVRLEWADDSADTVVTDLDRFVDGAAVMFPLANDAQAITMGDADHPVNAWFWKADASEPHDVLAHGFGTSRRRPGAVAGLRAASHYAEGHWHVVFQRALRPGTKVADQVAFSPRSATGIAVALWAGSNRERAGQKSVSGEWTPLEIPA